MNSKEIELISEHDHTKIVCWTKVQNSAGETFEEIVQRKEFERKVGDGIFFWGVGSAPSRHIADLVKRKESIEVIFSETNSERKTKADSPSGRLVWNAYFDLEGNEISIPRHVLVTSKSDVRRNRKGQLVYYTLICEATEPLSVGDYGPFDSANYKNIGDDGKRIGPSQVTALVERASNAAGNTKHRINLQAKLALDYWVRLSQPREIPADCELQRLVVENGEHEWIDKVTEIRQVFV